MVKGTLVVVEERWNITHFHSPSQIFSADLGIQPRVYNTVSLTFVKLLKNDFTELWWDFNVPLAKNDSSAYVVKLKHY